METSTNEFRASSWLRKQHEQHEYSEIQHDLSRRERALREELGNVMRLQFPHFVHLTRDTSSTLDDLQLLCSQLRAWCADSKAITASVVERVAAYDVPMRRRERITAHLKELQHLRRLAEALGNVEALLPSIQKLQVEESAGDISQLLSASTEYGRLMLLQKHATTSAAAYPCEPRSRAVRDSLLVQLRIFLQYVLQSAQPDAIVAVLRAFVEVGAPEQAESWLRAEWIMPRMLPMLEVAVSADEPLVALVDGVEKFLRSETCVPLLLPEVLALPLHVISNVVWIELCRFVTTHMEHMFGAGMPHIFQAAYVALADLQLQFEQLLPSAHERRFLRNHVATGELWRKFSLPIYFQLRMQEISRGLEAALPDGGTASPPNPCADASATDKAGLRSGLTCLAQPELVTVPARALVHSVNRCFCANVFLRPLASRFFRLALQCIARFNSWLQPWLQPAPDGGAAMVSIGYHTSSSPPTPLTPSAASEASGQLRPDTTLSTSEVASNAALSIAANSMAFDLHLDVAQLVAWLENQLKPELARLLRLSPDCSLQVECELALQESIGLLAESSAVLQSVLIKQHALACCKPLAQVRGIPALYRMTGKPLPTTHSIFIVDVFEPLQNQLTANKHRFSSKAHAEWVLKVADAVTKHYLTLTVATLDKVANDEKALRRHIAATKQLPSLAPGVVSSDVSDSDKIRVQLCLDVAAFEVELSKVGVAAEALSAFSGLQDAVRPDASLLDVGAAAGPVISSDSKSSLDPSTQYSAQTLEPESS